MTGWYSGCFKDYKNFQVVHRPGDKHGNADGLSRRCIITPELTEAERLVMFGSCPSANSLEDALGRINLVTAEDANEPMSIQFQEDVNSLRLAQRNDPCLRLILQWANAEKHPDQNPLRDLKVKKANALAQGEDAVAIWGLWDQMELTNGVLYRKCTKYRWNEKTIRRPLQTINVEIRFSKVAADILGPVTRAKESGAKYIIVLTDYFTKYVVCVPLERTTAEDVARAIVENSVLTFGAPDCLHTDQGAKFCSELLLEVCKIFGIEKTRTSSYHQQGNGMVERHNRVFADVISKYCANNPSSWDQMIPYLNFVYNTTVHKTTGQTPFSLVFGQQFKYPIDLLLPKAPGHEIANY
ncbi:SCAN domain-containing protein 3-like [Convolutriloba macropyga]|uniref:SCAN domain-containing protein 3-like n=1 Tax=Convolutriloba macropyga TaxID=536237 RepID=UPI003F520F8D